MTAELLAEKILKIIYGGRVRTGNDQISRNQILEAIRVERDYVVTDWMRSEASTGKPVDDTMFTAYEAEMVWDTTRLIAYSDLPYGYLSLPHDKGVRVRPISGVNMFRRVPSGYGSTVTANANLDGARIPWEIAPMFVGEKKRILFPTLTALQIRPIIQEVVVGDSRALPSGEVGIPDGLISLVENRVLSKYRPFINDKANDGRSQP
jgi:hypothetical protein